MRFIKNSAELKAANSSLSIDLELKSLDSFGIAVENELVHIIGESTIEEIEGNAFAFEILKRAVVDLTLSNYASSGAIIIADEGIHVMKSEHKLPASDKKLLTFRKDSSERGWAALEQLIGYMEAKETIFPSWRTSDNRNDYFSTLFFSSAEFSSFGGLHISASLFKVLKPIILRVQEDILYRDFGEELLLSLIEKRLARTLDDDEKKLERKMMRVLAPLALCEALPYQLIQVESGGLYTASVLAQSGIGDNVQQLSAAENSKLRMLMNHLASEGETKRISLLKWLDENGDKYSLYKREGDFFYLIDKVNDDRDRNIYLL